PLPRPPRSPPFPYTTLFRSRRPGFSANEKRDAAVGSAPFHRRLCVLAPSAGEQAGDQLVLELDAQGQLLAQARQVGLERLPDVAGLAVVFVVEIERGAGGVGNPRIELARELREPPTALGAVDDALVEGEVTGGDVVHQQLAELGQELLGRSPFPTAPVGI